MNSEDEGIAIQGRCWFVTANAVSARSKTSTVVEGDVVAMSMGN